MKPILVAGSAHLDILGQTLSRNDVTDRIGQVTVNIGGTACNIAIDIAHAGGAVRMLSAMNESAFSKIIANYLASVGIELHIDYRKDLPTGGFSAHLDTDGDLVSAVSCMPVERVVFDEARIAAAMDDAQAMVLDCNLSPLGINRLVTMANDRNLPVYVSAVSEEKALRIGTIPGRMKGIFLNQREYRFFCRNTLGAVMPPQDAARALGTIFIVTEGPLGASVAMPDGQSYHVPPPTVGESGTRLGMGDALAAGTILLHEAHGLPFPEAIAKAVKLVEAIGAKQNCHFGQDCLVESAIEDLRYKAGHDAMTGTLNRFSTEQALSREYERRHRGGELAKSLSLLILDIDHFKSVNDTYGHAAGDAVIIQVADVIKGCLREHDFVGRWGGEEFLIVLPDAAESDALHVAERIRTAIEATVRVPRPVTVSIGCCELPSGESVAAAAAIIPGMIKRADTALYAAKQGGRNRVCSAQRT